MGPGMIDPASIDLRDWIQASVGWTFLAARAAGPAASAAVEGLVRRSQAPASAPLRLRATITIDIDACDLQEAERQAEAIRARFELLKPAHPSAVLAFRRRKPRRSRRPPAPALVVAPYADD